MNGQTPKELTVKEAIEQGYTRFCREYDERCFHLTDIGDMPDFASHVWTLVDKEPTYLTVSPEEIYDDLVENFAINRDADDDDGRIGDAIVEAVNWDEIAAKITENLKKCPIYYPTKIKLIP
jgi:hypothetical protein